MTETRIPKTLALLRERGWCKDDLEDEAGRLCIIGAGFHAHDIRLAVGSRITEECLKDEHAIARVILAQHGTSSISDFNDDSGTTFEMVEAVLEKAALERGGSL